MNSAQFGAVHARVQSRFGYAEAFLSLSTTLLQHRGEQPQHFADSQVLQQSSDQEMCWHNYARSSGIRRQAINLLKCAQEFM